MIIQRGLIYDNKQNIVIPNLPKDLGMSWNPPKPGEGIEGFDGTPGAILRHVVYNRLPSETKQVERQNHGGLTRAEFLAEQKAQRERLADRHSLRWNPAKHRAKKQAKWARAHAAA